MSNRKSARCLTVEQLSLRSWATDLARFSRPQPYQSIRPQANADYSAALKIPLSWVVMGNQSSMSRLRLNALCLSHREGQRNHARYQNCIFCGQSVLSPYLHTFTSCSFWNEHRAAVVSWSSTTPENKLDFMLLVLRATPRDSVYPAAAKWAAALDNEESLFWRAEI